MAKEYIEREALYKEVTERYCDITAGAYPFNIVAYDMAKLVKNAPAADVVEVVHGEWINDFGSYSTMHCSKCEWRVPYIEDYWAIQELYSSLHNCPNCGAKMDGEKK